MFVLAPEGLRERPKSLPRGDLIPLIRICWLMLALLGAQEPFNIVFLAFKIVFFGSKSDPRALQEAFNSLQRREPDLDPVLDPILDAKVSPRGFKNEVFV